MAKIVAAYPGLSSLLPDRTGEQPVSLLGLAFRRVYLVSLVRLASLAHHSVPFGTSPLSET